MKSRFKILVTDINREKEPEVKLPEYAAMLNNQYNCYATVKTSMNYYTMREMLSGQDKNSDAVRYFNLLTGLIKKHIVGREAVEDKAVETVRQLRANVEHKMKNLTAYADGYEIYEYILNRIEAGIKGGVEQIDVEQLSTRLFRYVFSENDAVVINSKLQLLMAQLPVRMTKNKFYDIVTNTLSIYKGGETSSVDEFADMLRAAVLIRKPKGFETEYPFLYHVYCDLREADYKDMREDTFDSLRERLSRAAAVINQDVSVYMLLQEIINDTYTMLLTVGQAYEENMKVSGYKAAISILDACASCESMEEAAESMFSEFMHIEGVQEDVYENVMILEAAFDDIRQRYETLIDSLALQDSFARLSVVSRLLSTSLFVDLDRDYGQEAGETADSAYIMKLRDALTAELANAFEGKDRRVVRSMMSKLLASMPIFMNSQQEIKDYFDYVLENCKDDSELTACSKLVNELMED